MKNRALIETAVFPVAGRGTRFLPATKASPKEMLPVVDKPLIQYAVEEALAAGARRLVFITGASKRAIEDGAPAEALSILNRLIGANPDFAEAWNKRATLYFMMKKYDDALSDIAKVLDLEPRHFGALAGKGMILERQKNFSAAREAYEDALAVNPTLEDVKAAIKEIDRVEQGI